MKPRQEVHEARPAAGWLEVGGVEVGSGIGFGKRGRGQVRGVNRWDARRGVEAIGSPLTRRWRGDLSPRGEVGDEAATRGTRSPPCGGLV